jgi:hypothetical protein
MARKRKASSVDTPASGLATASPIALMVLQRSRKETAVSDNDVENYQLPSH